MDNSIATSMVCFLIFFSFYFSILCFSFVLFLIWFYSFSCILSPSLIC
jgi:hypothetical protein